MKIRKTDDTITVLAKKAAMITMYTIKNPLHVYFEEGNVTGDPMDFERIWNDIYRDDNGERMYEFIGSFLDEFEPLSIEDRRKVYQKYGDKVAYLAGKWRNKLRNSVNPPIPADKGMVFHQTLQEDGHIYFRVFSGPELLAF